MSRGNFKKIPASAVLLLLRGIPSGGMRRGLPLLVPGCAGLQDLTAEVVVFIFDRNPPAAGLDIKRKIPAPGRSEDGFTVVCG